MALAFAAAILKLSRLLRIHQSRLCNANRHIIMHNTNAMAWPRPTLCGFEQEGTRCPGNLQSLTLYSTPARERDHESARFNVNAKCADVANAMFILNVECQIVKHIERRKKLFTYNPHNLTNFVTLNITSIMKYR